MPVSPRKPSDRVYDVVVIGGGSAGISAAEAARDAGAAHVCLIEADKLGGECQNNACVPTKAMLAAAKMYYGLKHDAELFGIKTHDIAFDFSALMKRKNAVVDTITGKGKRLEKYLASRGITYVKARAIFEDENTVRAGSRIIKGKAFVIATGSSDIIPPIAGIEHVPFLTYRDLVSLRKLPPSIAIIGGGPVGSEFATFFGLLGVKTALINREEHILPREDAEVALLAEAQFRSIGINVLTKTTTLGLRKERQGTRVTYQAGKKPRKSMLVDQVAIAVGKKSNVDTLNLEAACVVLFENKNLILDAKLRTKVKHIFSAGDATSHPAFTSTAHHEGYIAGFNAANVDSPKNMREVDMAIIPHVTFIEPELASVGMTAKEAIELGYEITILRSPMNVLARAAIDGHRTGLMKVIVDRKTDQILGATMFGERAGEVIHELALAMHSLVPSSVLRSMLHAYPTYSEIIPALQEL